MIDLMTKAEAAKLMRMSEDTVEKLIAAGMLPYYRVAPRMIRIDREDVMAYLESRKHRAQALGRQTRVKLPKEIRRGGVNNSGYTPGMKVV